MSNTDINFQTWNLQYKSYIAEMIFLIIRQVKQIGKKKFTKTAFDLDYKAFILYIASFNISFNLCDKIYSLKKTNIVYL